MANKKKKNKKRSRAPQPNASRGAAKPEAAEPASAVATHEPRVKKKVRASSVDRRDAAAHSARKARRQWMAIIGVGVAIVGGVLVWSIVSALPEDGDTSATGWDLPVIQNDPDSDGRLTLAELAGRPVVANFYADWCTACEAELPAFSTVSSDLVDRVTFVGINSQESGNRLRLPREFGTDWWPLARDINGVQGGGSGLYDSLNGSPGMPITAFYDSNGQVVHVERGVLTEGALRGLIEREFGIV